MRKWLMKEMFTIPNAITVGRGFFGLFGIIIAFYPHMFLFGVVIFFALGMMPDLLDGWVARKYGQKSRVGEFLDPLVDKCLFYGVMFTHFFQYAWVPILGALFICDFISTGLHFVKVGGAVGYGKRKFLLQCIALGVFHIGDIMHKKFVSYHKNISSDFFLFVANLILIVALFYAVRSLLYRFNRTALI